MAGYQELAEGADVSLLTPADIVAYVSSYAQQQGVDISGLSPEGITAFVLAYEEIAGGALTTALTPDGVAAMVVKYLEAEGVDISALQPDQINAIVTSYSEATGCDKSQLLTNFTAYVTEYREASGASVTQPRTKVMITGYEYMAYKQLQKNTDLELQVPIRLGEMDSSELNSLLEQGKVQFWQDGIQVPIEAVPDGTITSDMVAALDQDGTLHILITPEITGTQEAIDTISPLIDEVDTLGTTDLGQAVGLQPATQMDKIASAIGRIQSYQDTLDYNWWDKLWASLSGASTDLSVLDQSMSYDFDSEDVAELSAYVGEMVSAILQGGSISEEDLANLQSIVTFLNGLDETGTGAHIREGIAQGMTDAGWDTDAETVASNLETALNSALDINSPSKRVQPIGDYAAQGIGVGLSSYTFATEAASVNSHLQTALSASISSTTLRSAGVNLMTGLRLGIIAGRAGVIASMRSAAQAAVNAAKEELQIHSPSRVFRDEVGAMAMKGLGEGILEESEAQAKAIRNASRFLTSEAAESAIGYTQTDNSRTYNSASNVNLSGNTFYIRDEQDVRSLATEIATLTKRMQRGKGLRMA